MLMASFFAAGFFWGNIANNAVGLAISKGQCEDGTPAGLCSENGMRCVLSKEKRECLSLASGLECRAIPKGYYLEPDSSCEVENA